MTTRRDFLGAASTVLAGAGLVREAMAQAFPTRPIQFIVPFPAGGTADVLCRLVGQHMTQRWGQPVVVETKPGGGTVIGMQMVARAPADGHTIVFISNSFVINAKLRSNLPYDGMKAFEPVASMFNSPQAVSVNAASPHRTLKDLLDAARARPGSISIATVGPATAQHIATEMLQRVAGIQIIYTAFVGDPPAINAVLGGHVDAILGSVATMLAHIDAGKLRPLAVTTAQRLEVLKHVPTIAESGYPGYEAVAWFGVAAPAGTPRDVVAKLSEGVGGAISDPEMLKRSAALGLQPAYMAPQVFAAHIARQYEHYAQVIDEAKIKAE